MFRTSGKTLALGLSLAATLVSVHAAQAQTVTKQINFAQPTSGIAVNPATDTVYVSAPSYGGPSDLVTVINGKTDIVTTNIIVPRGANQPVVDFLRNTVFATGCDTYGTSFSCIITKINGKTNKIIKSAALSNTPGDGILSVAIDLVCNKLYIANGSNFRIDIVDGNTLTVIGSISTNGQEPFSLSFNPIDERLYVTYNTNELQVINPYTKAIVGTTAFGTSDFATAVNWLTGNVFVTDAVFGPSTTGVFDKNGVLLAAVPVSDTPTVVDVDLVTNKAFVLSNGVPALTEIDGKTNTALGIVNGLNANYVAVNFATQKVYASGITGVTVVAE